MNKITKATKHLTTEQLKISAIKLYGTTCKERHAAYRLAITALEERLTTDAFDFFLDCLGRGRLGTVGGE